jgi:general secretion pathway protein J
MRVNSGVAGFTMLETLIATALMVAILVALATVTGQWLPNWNRGFARVQRAELAGIGLERLLADLAAAEFIPPNGEAKTPLFDGAELSVTFVRSALGPNTRPGLEIVRIAETADERGLALVRLRAPFVPMPAEGGLEQTKFSDPVVLLRAPYRISFSYAGGDRVWRDTWREAMLPSAVRVLVRDAATARTLAMSSATMIHVNVAAECVQAKSPKECPSLKADAASPVQAPKPAGGQAL